MMSKMDWITLADMGSSYLPVLCDHNHDSDKENSKNSRLINSHCLEYSGCIINTGIRTGTGTGTGTRN